VWFQKNICFQFLSVKSVASQNKGLFENNWLLSFILLILKRKLSVFNFALDRNQTDSHRFEPNSRTVLLDEQSNPLKILRLKDTTNRHQGHNRKRRFERLVFIILLSLAYLFSAELPFFQSIR